MQGNTSVRFWLRQGIRENSGDFRNNKTLGRMEDGKAEGVGSVSELAGADGL